MLCALLAVGTDIRSYSSAEQSDRGIDTKGGIRMKPSNLEIKLDLMAIIDAAFRDFDDYVTECHEKDIEPHEGVEAFVADAIINAGYSKVVTDNNVGGKKKERE